MTLQRYNMIFTSTNRCNVWKIFTNFKHFKFMQTLELNNYGAVELSTEEQREMDGGAIIIPWYVKAGGWVGVAIGVYDAVSDMFEGFKETAKVK